MWHRIRLFLVIFLLSFFVQSFIWSNTVFVDQTFWVSRVQDMYHLMSGSPLRIDLINYLGVSHPGTTPLLLASFLHWLGLPLLNSLRESVSILVALGIAGYTLLAATLRKDNWWYLGAFGILLLNKLWVRLSPLDAVVCIWIPLVFLLGLWLYEKKSHKKFIPLIFGLAIAVAFTTRLHITILMAGPLLLFLFWQTNIRQWWTIIGTASVFSYILNPFMWAHPIIFFRMALFDLSSLYEPTTNALRVDYFVTPQEIINVANLALIAILLTIVTIFYRKHRSPIPRYFNFLLFGSSIFAGLVFLSSNMQVLRFLLPIVFLWEALLPLLILHFITLVPDRPIYQKLPFTLKPILGITVLLLIMEVHLLSLVYTVGFDANYGPDPLALLPARHHNLTP